MKVEYKKTEIRTMDIPVPSFWSNGLIFYYLHQKDNVAVCDQVSNIGDDYSSLIISGSTAYLDFGKLIPIEQAEYEAALDKAILNIEKSVNRLCPQPDAVIHLSRQIIQAKNN